MARLEFKDCQLEIKADVDGRTTEGHASIFRNIDRGGDIMARGAFASNLVAGGRFDQNLIKTMRNHRILIGRPVSLKEDSKGLRFKARISETPDGIDTLLLAADEVLDRNSIGFIINKSERDDSPKARKKNNGFPIRTITDVELFEHSHVDFAMNESAMTTAVKALDWFEETDFDPVDMMAKMRDLSELLHKLETPRERELPEEHASEVKEPLDYSDPSVDLPFAKQGNDVHELKGEGELLWLCTSWTFKRSFSNYHLIGQGGLVYPDAVKLAAEQIHAGDTDLPAGMVEGAKESLAAQYERMRKEFDDPSLLPPWEKSAPEEEAVLAALESSIGKLQVLVESRPPT